MSERVPNNDLVAEPSGVGSTSRRLRLGATFAAMAMVATVVALSPTTASAIPGCDPFDPDPPPICNPVDDPADPPFVPRANGFNWSRPNRFTNTVPSHHWDEATASYAPTHVHPATWTADFDACATKADLVASVDGELTANTYTWLIRGEHIARRSCLLTYDRFPAQGTYEVQVAIAGPDAHQPFTQQVTIRDILIVSIGDSYASGEGNPVKVKSETQPAQWVDGRCHRSTIAGPAMAAAELERSDPHTSVTFLSFACSGATIDRAYFEPSDKFDFYSQDRNKRLGVGVLKPYRGAEPAHPDSYNPNTFLPPQTEQMETAVTCSAGSPGCLSGGRRIDALLMSGGGNDIGFGPVAASCVYHQDCTANAFVSHWLNGTGQITLSERFEHDAARMPGIFSSLANRLNATGLDIAGTYITEYPDPTTTNDPDDADGSCDRMLEDVMWPLPLEINAVEARWARDTVLARLNAEVFNAARTHGWTHVDGISGAFTGHGYCVKDDGQRWIRRAAESVKKQGPDDAAQTKGTLHPTLEGHRVYAERLVAYLQPDLAALGIEDGPPTEDPVGDKAGVVLSKATLNLVESGAADVYTLKLTAKPTSDVNVTISSSGLCAVSPAAFRFTATNWSTPQPVTVTPGDDDIAHSQSCTVTHAVTSADPAYDGLAPADVGGAVVDDDRAAVAIVAGDISLHEAAPATTGTYTVALTSEPTSDVTVGVTAADGQTAVDKHSLTFTATNWDTAQAITVLVLDDAVGETSPHVGIITHRTSSSDPNYGADAAMTVDGTPGDAVSVSIGDNETVTMLELSTPADDVTSVTATATVSGGDSPRAGTVQFAVDGSNVGAAVALSSDGAVLDLGVLEVGTHQVTATYSGDALHDGSQDSVEMVVSIGDRPGDGAPSVDGDNSGTDTVPASPTTSASTIPSRGATDTVPAATTTSASTIPSRGAADTVPAATTTSASTIPSRGAVSNQDTMVNPGAIPSRGATPNLGTAPNPGDTSNLVTTPSQGVMASRTGGSLPRTGSGPIPLVALGLVLIVAGALVFRTRLRPSRSTSRV